MSHVGHSIALGVLLLVCAAVLFMKLGAPALFEPDEGRNAEKPREILLLNDWVTPHENFLVVFDKPIFYYWLVAASYRAFGVSEWSARLPSALAGAGCIVLVFLFARRFFGFWEGLWSSLILLTSVEFFLLARIVIFDMTLTFLTTASLCSFFCALDEDKSWPRRSWLALMYASAALATLVKGPEGVILPGMVAFAYLLICRKLSSLSKLGLSFGIPLFLAIVAPWYYEAEQRNPGYLRYFLWEENFLRYFTPHFNRTEPWYYFFLVLAAGFLPWTLCIPGALREAWRSRRDHTFWFLLCWTIVPFLFFSLSGAKLPHYILPIYPPLALLTGVSLERSLNAQAVRRPWPLLLAALCLCLLLLGFLVAPTLHILPPAAHFVFAEVPPLLHGIVLLLAIGVAGFIVLLWSGRCKTQFALFVGLSLALVLYSDLLGSLMIGSSLGRSTRDFVSKADSRIPPGAQLVIYDTNLETLPFYLKITQPLWVVWSGKKDSVIGSFYLTEKGASSAPGFGRALLTFDEFNKQWTSAPADHFAVFVREGNLLRLEQQTSHPAKVLFEENGLLLVTN